MSTTNTTKRQCEREQEFAFNLSLTRTPSKELLESLQEIDDYRKGKVQLSSFDNTEELFDYLDNR